MPASEFKFEIMIAAREFLFVESDELYPYELWDEFGEALFLFLTDDEIDVLNFRFGGTETSRFTIEERRLILAKLKIRFYESALFDEMQQTMYSYESEFESELVALHSANEENFGFVDEKLKSVGIAHKPDSRRGFNFDAEIGGFPVYVWRFREVDVPLESLREMLQRAAFAGFSRFFLVVHIGLTRTIPAVIEGCIPFTVVPWFDDEKTKNSANSRDTIFTI
ncbi:MAG: hypothetical protein ACK5NT_14425 [Pyrinomonadaceae bacterium]